MTKTYFTDLHKKCLKTGELPDGCGLCSEIRDPKAGDIFNLLVPTLDDFDELKDENCSTIFWAQGIPKIQGEIIDRGIDYTPLRETIVLFCAAINNEL